MLLDIANGFILIDGYWVYAVLFSFQKVGFLVLKPIGKLNTSKYAPGLNRFNR